MIRKSDVQWWVLETKKHPESAPEIIEELARRLIELDSENERLRDQIIRLQRRTPATDNHAEVDALQRKVKELQSRLSDTGKHAGRTESSLILLSDQLQSARLPLSQAQQMARQGRPALNKRALLSLQCLLPARPHEELLLLTSQGRGLKLLQSEIPFLTDGQTGSGEQRSGERRPQGDWPASEKTLASGERLAAAVTVGREPPRFWTVATRRGYVQRFVRVAIERGMAQGDPLLKSHFRNDEPVAIVTGDRGDLLLITRWGKGVRFSQRAIETSGSVALRLDTDDEVVAALTLPSDSGTRSTEILILTASGRALRRDTSQFVARSRPGGTGRTLIQAQDVLTAFPYPASTSRSPDRGRRTSVLCLTFSGKLAFFPTANIPLQERASKGIPLRDLSHDPAVVATLIVEYLT